MKQHHISFLLLGCITLCSCSSTRSTSNTSSNSAYDRGEGTSIFPGTIQYVGKTIQLTTKDTQPKYIEAQLDYIADEPEESYRARYDSFFRDTLNHNAAIRLDSEITISLWASNRTKSSRIFKGYTADGILASDTSGTKVYEYWTIDSLKENASGRFVTTAELLRLVKENALPVRGLMHFRGRGNEKYFAMTNSEFRTAYAIHTTSSDEAFFENRASSAQESADNSFWDGVCSSCGGALINGFFDALFSSDKDSDKDKKDDGKKNDEDTKKNDDDQNKEKKGRIKGGEERKK